MIVDAVNGGKLEATANKSFTRMSTAYGAPIPCNSMFRSAAEQQELRDKYLAKVPGYAYAAPVGVSEHPRGVAIDVARAMYLWMEIHARSHGWIRTDPNERWHYVYRYAYDTRRFAALPIVVRPAPLPIVTTPKDDEMVPFIQTLYRAYLDREPSPLDLLSWARTAVSAGYANTTEFENAFKRSRAEAGTVHAAFRHYLGRAPSATEVTGWSDTETIAEVWAGVSGSPEAVARRIAR